VVALGDWLVASILVANGMASILVAEGMAGHMGYVINTATATTPLVIFTIIAAASMHLFMHFVRVLQETPEGVPQAASTALSAQLRPIALTSVMTIACMLSLTSVNSPPIREIGVVSSVGVLFGTLFLFTVVPLSLSKLNSVRSSKWHSFIQPKLNDYARLVEKSAPVSLLAVGLVLASLVSIYKLEIDDDFVRYFHSENEFRADTEFTSRHLFCPNNIELVVSPDDGALYSADLFGFVGGLSEYLRSREDIKSVSSIKDVSDVAREHFSDGSGKRAFDSESIAQSVLAYELSLEHGQSLSDLVSFDHSAVRISIVTHDITSVGVRRLEREIYSWVEQSGYQHDLEVTGESIPISHLTTENLGAVTLSIATTFLLASIVLGVIQRSIRVGLVVLITTIVPVLCGFGIWGLTVSSIGLSTTVIIAVCMGVVIDDAIHIVYRQQEGMRRLSLSPSEASAYSIHRVGSAVLTTSIVFVFGFGVLFLSDFGLNSVFGACTALILGCALAVDLFLLPRMLVWASSNRK